MRGQCMREWDGGEEKKIINVHTFGFNCYINLNLNLNIVMSAKSFGTSRQL